MHVRSNERERERERERCETCACVHAFLCVSVCGLLKVISELVVLLECCQLVGLKFVRINWYVRTAHILLGVIS